MPSGEEYHTNYKVRRKALGKLTLENKAYENVVQMLADGHSEEEVMNTYKIDPQDLADHILSNVEVQRRLAYLKSQKERTKEPSSPDEMIAFAKNVIFKIARGAESDKDRTAAAKVYYDIAKTEKGEAPPAGSAGDTAALDEMKKAFD